MAVLEVYEYPHPLLKEICTEVADFNEELKISISNLVETLNYYKYCVGLAAPQVGILKRIIAVDVSRARKPSDNNGLLVMVNPVILDASDFKIVREGCLSIPDFTANVKRAMQLVVFYVDENGKSKTLQTANFEAHAIQHELDHLNGVLFLDKIASPATDLFKRIQRIPEIT